MDSSTLPKLSKSRFLSGLQCPLRLWYTCFNPELATPVTAAQQALFDTGHAVGELATRLFPGGVLIQEDYFLHEAAVVTTQQVLQNPDVTAIFEAAFFYNDVRIRVDILERSSNGQWNMIEVKSSTSVKDVHLPDVAVQHYVLQGSGVSVNRVFLQLINNQYVYDGNRLDFENLFSFNDVTEQAFSFQNEIPMRIEEYKQMLRSPHAPAIQPSRHCTSPYRCEFWEHCTKDMPEHWVLGLYGISQGKLDELAGMNIQDIRDIPDAFNLTELQARMKRCVQNNETFVSQRLYGQLTEVEYPVHFLDFETVNPAIPCYAGTRPYQIIPFQWSDHVLSPDGSVAHRSYLCQDHSDPREEFARTLLDVLGTQGTIFIYTNYERSVISTLAEHFPQYRDALLRIPERFKDLCAIIRNNFYDPGFRGSFSLKSVLPVLVPEMRYDSLAIQDGSHASYEYLRSINPDTPSEEKAEIKENLLTYCSYDTLAMLRVRDQLIKRI